MSADNNENLLKARDHCLPYRMLMEEIKIRHEEAVPVDIDTKLTHWEAKQNSVQELRELDQPRLDEYRRTQNECAELEKPLKQILHKANLNALCFSGGGIRSASFGLGALTQLARLSGASATGALNEIDYVSTVSGGGYLGSWLTGWIRAKKSLQGVIEEMAGNPVTSTDPEPAPVRHLRDYTSYLAPRSGLLSADVWTLVAIFVRNLLLNWAILLPAFAAVLLLPVLSTYWFAWERMHPFTFLTAAVIFAGLAVFCIAFSLPGNFEIQPKKSWANSFPWSAILVSIAACALAGYCLYVYSKPGDGAFDKSDYFKIFLLTGLAHLGLFIRRVIIARKRKVEEKVAPFWRSRLVQFGILLASSAFGAMLLWVLAIYVGPHLLASSVSGPSKADIRLFVSVSVPLILSAFALNMVLLNGLSAQVDLEEDREWWSRSGAFLLITMIVWPLVHLLVLYSREIIEAIRAVFRVPGYVSIPALTTAIGAVASRLGFSPATPSGHAKVDIEKLKGVAGFLARRNMLIPALGTTFFVLLGIGLSQGNDWIMRKMAGVSPVASIPLNAIWWELAAAGFLALLMNGFVNVNTFSLHAMYRGRLVRSYLGASNDKRRPNPFINFDAKDNFAMQDAPKDKNAPLHVVNMALNLVASSKLAWQQRKAESFTVTALYSGSYRVGYQRTDQYAGTRGITLGTAMAISGAAASPNMGYHSSPILSLVMTFFNARLGWWLPNPGDAGKGYWEKTSPAFSLGPLLNEALGRTTDTNRWVYVSDGGHFENLGLYEMVMRRCKKIIVVDGGCDPDYKFEDLGNAVRKIFIDFGVPIKFTPAVSLDKVPKPDNHHVFFGTIKYSCVDGKKHPDGTDVTDGELLYIKASLSGDEPADVTQYYKAHPDFPHESTANQFFNESQFESYVRLGSHVVDSLGTEDKGPFSLEQIFEKFRPAPPQAAAAGATAGRP